MARHRRRAHSRLQTAGAVLLGVAGVGLTTVGVAAAAGDDEGLLPLTCAVAPGKGCPNPGAVADIRAYPRPVACLHAVVDPANSKLAAEVPCPTPDSAGAAPGTASPAERGQRAPKPKTIAGSSDSSSDSSGNSTGSGVHRVPVVQH